MTIIYPRFAGRAAPVSAFCAVIFLTAGAEAAGPEFNRLNACADIATAFNTLKLPPTRCEAPADVIGHVIRGASDGQDPNVCFIRRPPTFLSEFNCIGYSYRQFRSLTCYRPAAASTLADFKRNYTSLYASSIAQYLNQASKCPGANGDTSRIIDTTFPPILTPAARPEFGFIAQYGESKPGTALVGHGFASTAPTVSDRGPQAIEYVHFATGAITGTTARTAIGDWSLDIDTASDLGSVFMRALKKQAGLNAYMADVSVDLRRAPRAPRLSKSPSVADSLAGLAVSIYEDEDFEEMSDEDFERQTGKSKNQLIEQVINSVPFGAPNFLAGRKLNIRLLLKTSGVPCTLGKRGALAGYLLHYDGAADVQVDFGNISFMTIGFGSCAAGSGRQYVRNLSKEITDSLLKKLGS